MAIHNGFRYKLVGMLPVFVALKKSGNNAVCVALSKFLLQKDLNSLTNKSIPPCRFEFIPIFLKELFYDYSK